MTTKIILGTRGSELARAQARLVEKAIQAARPDVGIETRLVTTQGDKVGPLERQAGRKGVFTAEIERALLAGDVLAAGATDLAGVIQGCQSLDARRLLRTTDA